MKIQVTICNVYGTETVYPVCRHARFLAAMAHGYEVEVVAHTGRLVGVGA